MILFRLRKLVGDRRTAPREYLKDYKKKIIITKEEKTEDAILLTGTN